MKSDLKLNYNKTNKLVNLIDNVEKLLSSEFQSKDGETKIKGDEAITTRLFSIIANGDDKTSLFAINLLKELLKLKYQQDTNLFWISWILILLFYN